MIIILSSETIQGAFFQNYAPFSTWTFYSLSCSLSKEQYNNYTIKRDNSMCIFLRIMPPFRLRLFILYQAPHSLALAPACGTLVKMPTFLIKSIMQLSRTF